MTKIELEIHDDVVTTINKMKNIEDESVEIVIPEGSVLFENILNIKLIKKQAEVMGFVVHFVTDDESGIKLLDLAEEKTDTIGFSEEDYPETQTQIAGFYDRTTSGMPGRSGEKILAGDSGIPSKTRRSDPYESRGFVQPSEETSGGVLDFETQPKTLHKIKKRKLSKIKFNIPKIPIPFSGMVKAVFVLLIIILAVGGFFYTYTKNQEATVKIKVDSKPLTRSLSIRVSSTGETSLENKTLKGERISAVIEGNKEKETTGEKTIGEKATGEITIFNNTDEEKEFKEGTEIIYERDDKDDLIYFLDDDITVSARTELEPDPEEPEIVSYKKGETTAKVTAADIGDTYNIDKNTDLKIEDQKTSNFSAKAKEDIDGGTSEKVKVVTEEDKTTLSDELTKESYESAQNALKGKVGLKQELINGSIETSVIEQTYSHDIDEETDKLILNQKAQAFGLAYMTNDLNSMLDDLVDEFVPEGKVLSDKEREVNVEVLGNSTDSVLNSTEADIQVTLKTYVVTNIDENKLKEDLAGKAPKEVQKILGSIGDIKTYKFELSKGIPYLSRVPNDKEKIKISIERE